MENMEYRMQKTDAILFVEDWRQNDYDEQKFINIWMKASETFHILVMRQLDWDEFHKVLDYPIWK